MATFVRLGAGTGEWTLAVSPAALSGHRRQTGRRSGEHTSEETSWQGKDLSRQERAIQQCVCQR
jgi:hypothetical protein